MIVFCLPVLAAENSCRGNTAQTSMYFIPTLKDYCNSPTPCAAFKRKVRMQGSGTLPGNRLLTSSGKTISLGSCDTAFGAGGDCLIPFVSVAADARYYNIGDIIQMPALKGKVFTLPNGKKFVHPGYLIVQDTGGAIRGRNRFDFFTGSYDLDDSRNPFGTQGLGDVQISDIGDCTGKQFTVIRRGDGGRYQATMVAIENSLAKVDSRQLASSVNDEGSSVVSGRTYGGVR